MLLKGRSGPSRAAASAFTRKEQSASAAGRRRDCRDRREAEATAIAGQALVSRKELRVAAKVVVMTDLQCSFCGKQQDRVKRLIAGPGVYICDECVQLCQEILAEEHGGEAESTPTGGRGGHVEPPLESAAGVLAEAGLPESFENLSYRQRRVLELRYGLSGEQSRTLEEVGTTFNLTREQIREIENQSLNKLREWAGPQPD